MCDDLFDRIVDQLSGKTIEYLCPYLMADGLSDKKIFQRINQLRSVLPRTHFELSTTGMYLSPKLADRLLDAPLSEVRISSHGITKEQYALTMPGVNFDRAMNNIMRFVDNWQRRKPFQLSVVCLWGLWPAETERMIEAFWASRGVPISQWRVVTRANHVDLTVFGESPQDPTAYALRGEPPYRCRFDRDKKWMHILSDGRVSLCCMDYEQQAIVGDASRQSLEEIWVSPSFDSARSKVRGCESSDSSFICNQCEWRISESLPQTSDAIKDLPRNSEAQIALTP